MYTMVSKREAVEMLYRCNPMPADVLEAIITAYCMKVSEEQLIISFNKATGGTLKYAGGNQYEIIY